MKSIFGILSLLLVVAVAGILAKKQLGATANIKVPGINTSTTAGPADPAALPALAAISATGNVQQQSLQIQQQFKAAAEAALQQPRGLPDDKP